MANLVLILGDQLSLSVSSLQGYDRATDYVLMCEVDAEATYVRHHKKKIAFVFSAMRHFAALLRQQGYSVLYTRLDAPDNAGSLREEVRKQFKHKQFDRVIVTAPGEYRLLEEMRGWEKDFGLPVEIRENDLFLCSPEQFARWARGRKQLRMEYFYRDMRKMYGILMEGEEPVGGQWNYDAENRKPPKEGLRVPPPCETEVDAITKEVLLLVERRFPGSFWQSGEFFFCGHPRTGPCRAGQIYQRAAGSFWGLSGCDDSRRTLDVSLSYQFLSKLRAFTPFRMCESCRKSLSDKARLPLMPLKDLSARSSAGANIYAGFTG